MKLQPVYIAVALVLAAITINGVLHATSHTTDLEGITTKLTNTWFGYVNETGLFAYGAQITLTNTRPTNITLDNLRAEVYGVGGDKTWSKNVPNLGNITLPPGTTKTIDIYSSDLNTTTLGVAGARGSGDGYLYSTEEQMNKMMVKLEGDTVSLGDPLQFTIMVGPSQDMRTATEQSVGSHYSGLFWFITPTEYFTYQPLQRGVLGTAKIPYLTLISGSDHDSVSFSMVKARTLTVLGGDAPVVFYLMDGEFKFDSYLNSLGRDGDQLYFYGRVMDYYAPNGRSYKVLQLTEAGVNEIVDPAVVARNLIVSSVGEDYFRQYFSGPSVDYRQFGGNSTHVVSYTYHMSVGNYSTSQEVTLSFDYLWRPAGGVEFIPKQGNLQPFNVTRERAEEIAVAAGVPREPYGLEASLLFSGPVPGGPVNRYDDKYVWFVSSWVDPSSSNPRRNIEAVIDPVSSEVYAVIHGEFGIVSVG